MPYQYTTSLCTCGCGQTVIPPKRFRKGHKRPRSESEVITRFWQYVRIGNPDECWLWSGTNDGHGYGQFFISRRNQPPSVRAHRFSWQLANGPIPPGLCVCHCCDTPLCINPSHLFLGTIADNDRDRDMKGRHGKRGAVGETNGAHKLTWSIVRRMRDDYLNRMTRPALVRSYGMSHSQVTRIIRNECWKEAAA